MEFGLNALNFEANYKEICSPQAIKRRTTTFGKWR